MHLNIRSRITGKLLIYQFEEYTPDLPVSIVLHIELLIFLLEKQTQRHKQGGGRVER